LITHVGFPLSFHPVTAQIQNFDLKPNLIARHNAAFEFSPICPGEVVDVSVIDRTFAGMERQNTCRLSQCLNK